MPRSSAELLQLRGRGREVARAHPGESARVVPDPGQVAAARIRTGLPEERVPASEAREREVRNRHEFLHERELVHTLARLRLELARTHDRELAATLDARRRPQEVNVVRIVVGAVEDSGSAPREEGFIRRCGSLIDLDGFVIAPHADQDPAPGSIGIRKIGI